MPRSTAGVLAASRLDAARIWKRRLRRTLRAIVDHLHQLPRGIGWSHEPALVPVPVRVRPGRPIRRDI